MGKNQVMIKFLRILNFYIPTFLLVGISGIPIFMTDQFLIITFMYFLFLALSKKIKIYRSEVLIIFIFSVLFVVQFEIFSNYSFVTLLGTLLRMLIGLFYLKIMKKNIVFSFVSSMNVISLFSLFIYLLVNVNPIILNFFKDISILNGEEWEKFSTIIIYQFSPLSDVTRNIGPFWEPGVFGVFLIISLYFKLFLLKLPVRKCLIEILCIITTISTATYLLFFLVLIYYASRSFKVRSKLLILPVIFITASYLYSSTEVLGEKINDQLIEATVSDRMIGENRFLSILRDYNDLQESFFWGTGFYLENRFFYSPGRTNSNSGLSNQIVTFGFFGSLLFFYLLYRGTYHLFLDFFRNHNPLYINKSVIVKANNFEIKKLSKIFFAILLTASVSELILSMSFIYMLMMHQRINNKQ